mmetsp:Transcript_44900/g.101647  ORF Transcript_44900/g.101647 Transcript_44900/m.101647 type:complete len:257 (+) Transcript_44900:479-1249(+)
MQYTRGALDCLLVASTPVDITVPHEPSDEASLSAAVENALLDQYGGAPVLLRAAGSSAAGVIKEPLCTDTLPVSVHSSLIEADFLLPCTSLVLPGNGSFRIRARVSALAWARTGRRCCDIFDVLVRDLAATVSCRVHEALCDEELRKAVLRPPASAVTVNLRPRLLREHRCEGACSVPFALASNEDGISLHALLGIGGELHEFVDSALVSEEVASEKLHDAIPVAKCRTVFFDFKILIAVFACCVAISVAIFWKPV